MKKAIIVYRDSQNQIAEERVWIKAKGNYYEVRNIPFFAPNLALFDVIAVEEDSENLYFDDLIEASGHSAIQIIFFKTDENKRVIQKLENFGCQWEGMYNEKYFSVDISPQLDYTLIKQFLEKEAFKGVLDFKEACLSTIHR